MKWFPSVSVFSAALSVALLPLHADNIYVVDTANSAVLQVTPGGVVSTFLQDAVNLKSVSDVTFGPDGSLFAYVEDSSSFRSFVSWYKPNATWSGIYGAESPGVGGLGIASDPFGNVVIRRRQFQAGLNDVFLRWDAGTQTLSPFGGTAIHDSENTSSTMDAAGNFYYDMASLIRKISPAGVTTGITSPADNTPIRNLAADLSSNLYADMTVSSVRGIYRVDQNGDPTLIAPGVFGYMAVGASGDIFVNQAGTLLEVTPGGVVTPIASGLPNAPIAAIVPEPISGVLLGMGAALVLSGTRRRGRKMGEFQAIPT